MTDMVSKKKLTDRSPRAQGGAVKNQIASATFTSVLLARREEPQHATVDIVRLNPVLLARREEPTLDCARRYAVFFRSPRAQGGACTGCTDRYGLQPFSSRAGRSPLASTGHRLIPMREVPAS